MSHHLAAEKLMSHVRALADTIGPRPPGHAAEEQARTYIRTTLADLGYPPPERLPFTTIDEPTYALYYPLLLALGGAVLGELGGRGGKLIGAAASLFAATSFWRYTSGGRQPLNQFAPQYPSATLLARLPPSGPPRRRVVLIGHTDTQRAYPIFRPEFKASILASYSQILAALAASGLALLARSLGWRWAAPIGWASSLFQTSLLRYIRPGLNLPFVAGANDNATAVACLLGLAAVLRETPLRETEVWFAFTGAEETMCYGMHELLDRYGDELRDAFFIDFEMVGSAEIVYVTRHSGLTFLSAYRPDAESLALATRVATQQPELGIHGRELVITEEVGTLRQRGFRGLCIAGVGPDGWLENWHLPSDVSENITPAGIERAARFALAMLHTLDAGKNA